MKQIAQYTLAERVQNAHIENAMIAALSPRRVAEPKPEVVAIPVPTSKLNKSILAMIETPSTATDIAAQLDMGQGHVVWHLRRMRDDGLVCNVKQGGLSLWHLPGCAPQHEPEPSQSDRARARMLSALTVPSTAKVLGEKVGCDSRSVTELLKRMERDGLVTRAGHDVKRGGNAAVIWARNCDFEEPTT